MFFNSNNIQNYPNSYVYSQIPQTQNALVLLPEKHYCSYPVPLTQSQAITFTGPHVSGGGDLLGPSPSARSDHHPVGNAHHARHVEKFEKDRETKDMALSARYDAINAFKKLGDEHPDSLKYLKSEINDSVISDIFIEDYLHGSCGLDSESSCFLGLKGFVLIFVFAMYITCFLLITESLRSITSCEQGVVKKRPVDFQKPADYYNCSDLNQFCKFDWLGQNLKIQSYLVARLASYIVSSFPFIFTLYAKQRHLKNWINKIMGSSKEKRGRFLDSRESRHAVEYIKTIGANLDKDSLKSTSVYLFVIIYILMGVMIFVLDIDFALFLGNNNDPNAKACINIITSGKDHTDFINYVDEEGGKMNIHILCILLTTLNALYFAWAIVYITATWWTKSSQDLTKKLYEEDELEMRIKRQKEERLMAGL